MRYGVVKATFWTDPKVEGLSLHAKAIFLHFLTCPELTIVGLVNVSPGIMGYRLGMDTPSVLLAIKELEGIGAVKSDYENQVFWVVNFMKHNKPLGPKQIKGCVSCLKLYEFTTLSKDLSKTYRGSIQEVCKPQEQEQVHEQDHEQETKSKYASVYASDYASSCKQTLADASRGVVEKVLAHLNEKAGKKFATSGGRSESSAKLVADRLRQGFTEEELIAVIDLKASQWLGGEFAKYLRPATLFNKTKFEQYVGEIGAKSSIEQRAEAARAAEDKRKAEEKPTQDTATWVSTDQAIADGLIPPSQFALEHAQYERRMAKMKATSAGGTA